MFRKARKFRGFFLPKLGDLQKKKVFAKIRSDFSAEIQSFFLLKLGNLKKKKKKKVFAKIEATISSNFANSDV